MSHRKKHPCLTGTTLTKTLAITLALVASFTFSGPLYADIAYSNFGQNDEFNSGSGSVLIGRASDQAPNVHYASQFTSEASGFVTTVDVAVSLSNPGQNDSMLITLWDDQNNLPGSAIWSGDFMPRFVAEIWNVSSSSGPVELVAGEQYWVTARASNATGTYLWYRNSTGAEGRVTFDFFGGTNWRAPSIFEETAFRVNVATIPEPATLPAILLSSLFFLRRTRNRTQKNRTQTKKLSY